MNICGQRIRAARIKHEPRISQMDLVDCLEGLGVTLDRTSLSRVENQQRGVADYELKAFAKCLNTTVSDLLGDHSTVKPKR